ncbi:hypothetical protein ACQKJC_08780 [Priestia koreensis]|uniref:hypothetical protein n=1 Tax=Priestia koreensis TaxID=284581 RepID=UPI003D026C2C
MEKSSFFNSVSGDRRYKAEDFANYFNKFISNGVFPDNLQVVASADMKTKIKSGSAWIGGYMYENTSEVLLTHEPSDGSLNRIDRIVIRLNYQERSIKAAIKPSIVSSSPVAQTLQRDSDIYELAIADVYIKAGSLTITQANITDQRGNGQLCGTVNNLFAMQNVNASAVLVNDSNQNYDNTNLEAVLDELKRPLNVYRSGMDANDKYTVVEFKRSSGTLFKKSVLSNLVNNVYTIQTVTYYATDGTTVLKTEVFDLYWNANGDIQNEVKR